MDKRERIELNFAIFRSNYLEHHTDIDLNEPRVRDNMSEDLEKIEAGMIALLEED